MKKDRGVVIGEFILMGTILTDQEAWNTHVLSGRRVAKENDILQKDFYSRCLMAFNEIKNSIKQKAQETKDKHEELLERSENGNPFGQNHFLGENMIGAKGLEDLRAGWAKTQATQIEEIPVFLSECLSKYTSHEDINIKIALVSAAGRSYTLRDFEGYENSFKVACENIEKEKEKENKEEQPKYNLSDFEWATIFYYAESASLIPGRRKSDKVREFFKTHGLTFSEKSFLNNISKANKRINKNNDYPLTKLNNILPCVTEYYQLLVVKITNDIDFLRDEQANSE